MRSGRSDEFRPARPSSPADILGRKDTCHVDHDRSPRRRRRPRYRSRPRPARRPGAGHPIAAGPVSPSGSPSGVAPRLVTRSTGRGGAEPRPPPRESGPESGRPATGDPLTRIPGRVEPGRAGIRPGPHESAEPVPRVGGRGRRARDPRPSVPGPHFQRLFPDVYAPAAAEPNLLLRSRAAAVHVGGRGVVVGYSAAELLGRSCGPADAPAEVTRAHRVPQPARAGRCTASVRRSTR